MKDRRDLYQLLMEDVRARTSWEERQRLWYEMRHGGLRRKKKLPWQADLHYPLADSLINKLKPFYFQQVYGNELAATFIPTNDQADEALARQMSIWFDHQIKQKSNFEQEVLTCIDHTLTQGVGYLKISWNQDKKTVHFDSIDPINIILPYYTTDLSKVERICHVMQMSVDAYKSNELYDQDILSKIKGRESEGARATTFEDTKLRREGITVGSESDQVVVWEVYERTPDGRIMVHTFSPVAPEHDIRPSFELPYKHGEVPFVPFFTEIKDKGIYSSRGICEMVAPFEAFLCKLLNEKADAMTLYNRPLFRCEQDIPNTNNLRFGPATILPVGVAPVPMPQPPISFDQEMINQRMIAEYLTSMPDFGLAQQQSSKNARTATEVSQIGALMGQSTDLRARIFRLSLGKVYRQAYAVLCQFARKELNYLYANSYRALPEHAIGDHYDVMPSGSADGVNKAVQFQKAVARMQLFAGNQIVDQVGLVRSVLETDDPSLATKLVLDPATRQLSQGEEQSMENLVMEQGVPAAVDASDDHLLHINVLLNRIQQLEQMGGGLPQAQQLYAQHLEQHLQYLGLRDKNMERALRKQIRELAKQKEAQLSQGNSTTMGAM
jgi:hypothetical protein